MNDHPFPTCTKFQKEQLLLYSYDELPAGEKESLRRHLLTCAECRREVEAVTAVRAAAKEPILQENPPARIEVKLRAAARESRAGKAGLLARVWAGVQMPGFLYAGAAGLALLALLGFCYRYWVSHQTRPEDFDNQGLVALIKEVDQWESPPLEALRPEATPLEEVEMELSEMSPEPQTRMETWYQEMNPNGLEDIERGLRELDSGVRYL